MFGFVDELVIDVSSGNGGAGCVSFRREKYVPKGGPNGGDGGRGGDVVFMVAKNLKTLAHLRAHRDYRAENGMPGSGRDRHGKDGRDVVIPVPPGTLVREVETGTLVKDFTDSEGTWAYLHGGRGGKGNTHFTTATHRTPRFAQPGEQGSSVSVKIELNVIANVGFIGFPNAGKSTLLSVLTNAHPKTAAYPFTTKIPNLGVLRVEDREVVLADIPGIIEGASNGAGLGLQFLRHIRRTSTLAFLIDLSDDSFLSAFETLVDELRAYESDLVEKSRVVIGTKLDIAGTEERLAELRRALPDERVFGISAATHRGLAELEQVFLGGERIAVRTVVLGGSFDPIHIGHLFLAEEARVCLQCERVILVPSNLPALKTADSKVEPGQRLAMIRDSIAGLPYLEVDDCEIRRGGVSYTVDTIAELSERRSLGEKPGFIIGDDLIEGYPRWKEPERLAALAEIIIAHRTTDRAIAFPFPHRYLDNLRLPISSSDIRARIRSGRPFRHIVPEGAFRYIERERLYQ